MILNSKKLAFSLIELSIVILILSIVISSALNVLGDKSQVQKSLNTETKLNYIAKAIKVYALNANRLPCPMGIGKTANSADFGVQSINGGDTTDCIDGYDNDLGTVSGFVPALTIGLPMEYMYDEWGRLIIYYMSETLASTDLSATLEQPSIDVVNLDSEGEENTVMWRYASATEIGTDVDDCRDNGTSSFDNVTSNTLIPICAAFVLVSHGANGYGSVNLAGTVLSGASGSAEELNNAVSTNDGNSETDEHIKIFTLPLNTSSASSYADYFDDVIVYMSKESILNTQ